MNLDWVDLAISALSGAGSVAAFVYAKAKLAGRKEADTESLVKAVEDMTNEGKKRANAIENIDKHLTEVDTKISDRLATLEKILNGDAQMAGLIKRVTDLEKAVSDAVSQPTCVANHEKLRENLHALRDKMMAYDLQALGTKKDVEALTKGVEEIKVLIKDMGRKLDAALNRPLGRIPTNPPTEEEG